MGRPRPRSTGLARPPGWQVAAAAGLAYPAVSGRRRNAMGLRQLGDGPRRDLSQLEIGGRDVVVEAVGPSSSDSVHGGARPTGGAPGGGGGVRRLPAGEWFGGKGPDTT